MVAIAPTVGKVIQYAGGWLFDRVMAGWDVTVLVSDLVDPRPLEILGVGVLDLEAGLAAKERAPLPHAVATDADLCAADAQILGRLLRLFEQGTTREVTLWGEKWPAELEYRVDTMQHRLSFAAQAFKAQALSAAAVPTRFDATEVFRSWDTRREGRGARDLASV